MDEPEDVDMTTSTTLPAQNHDRQDDAMVDGGDAAPAPPHDERQTTTTVTTQPSNIDDIQVSGDVMDTTPDGSPAPMLEEPEQAPAESQAEDITALVTAAVASQTVTADASNDANGEAVPPVTSESGSADITAIVVEESQPSNPDQTSPLPPPLPPGNEAANQNDETSSISSEEGGHQWREMVEDTSAPDEQEMKEIEEMAEHSALDDDYWEKRTFSALDDPEYKVAATGMINWHIDPFNGTKDNPNMELMMTSQTVKIGGYEWYIKLYPRGNDSEYLSVYIECADMVRAAEKASRQKLKQKSKESTPGVKELADTSTEVPTEESPDKEPESWQHTPLPLLDPKRIPKRPSVAAQFSIIMYNPAEPRVNFYRSICHRFCPNSPDYGFAHYYGPPYELQHRQRASRQAMLRNDKLAFIARIQLIEDPTGCLWEHSQRSNPYDSLLITGLQGISNATFGLSGGNIISAVSTWMLLMPFRELLYEVKVPHPEKEARQRPKPMLLALQKVLYCLRTRPEGVGNGPLSLEDLLDAFEWYALEKNMDKFDVIEIWEILRSKLEEELRGTPYEHRLTELFGPSRNRALNVPTYKVPVQGSETMQKAIEKAHNLVDGSYELPKVLTIELERYSFDTENRSWKKISERAKLDDHVTVQGQGYTMFGFVVHKENAQSGYYHSVLRPNGPESKWYMYTDSRDDNKVMCLTKKAAVLAHEGTDPKKPNNEQASVAYIVTYIRNDIAEKAFCIENEPAWDVPDWLVEDVKKDRELDVDFHMTDLPLTNGDSAASKDKSTEKEAKPPIEFSVIRSKAFLEHEGPGLIDLYDPKWESSEHVFTVSLDGGFRATEARDRVASTVPEIKDPRQCRFWIIGSPEGSVWRPQLVTTGKKEISGGSMDLDIDWTVEELASRAPEKRLWLDVVDEKDLPPPMPKLDKSSKKAKSAAGLPPPPPPGAMIPLPGMMGIPPGAPIPPPAVMFGAPMPPTGALIPPPGVPAMFAAGLPPPPPPATAEDLLMGGTQDESIPPPSSNGLPIPPMPPVPPVEPLPFVLDTEMGDVPPMPPMPTGLPTGLPVPSPPQFELANGAGMPLPMPIPAPPRVEEVYFFVKTFDPKTQSLKPHGSYFANKKSRVDHVIHKILDVPKDDKTLLIFEEDDISSAHALRRRRTFQEEEIHNGSIIVAQKGLTDEEKEDLSKQGLFTDPGSYLHALADERNFSHTANGTFTLDYFSAESYTGQLKYHIPHGTGSKIYHNADTYTGEFVLGKRHGHGTMTFANGDVYTGAWEHNAQHGQGVYTELDTGNVYEGGWKSGKKYGEGVTRWKMAQNEERVCRICWEDKAEMAFVDCGHVVACLACARQVRDCPVCRRSVKQVVKLFYV